MWCFVYIFLTIGLLLKCELTDGANENIRQKINQPDTLGEDSLWNFQDNRSLKAPYNKPQKYLISKINNHTLKKYYESRRSTESSNMKFINAKETPKLNRERKSLKSVRNNDSPKDYTFESITNNESPPLKSSKKLIDIVNSQSWKYPRIPKNESDANSSHQIGSNLRKKRVFGDKNSNKKYQLNNYINLFVDSKNNGTKDIKIESYVNDSRSNNTNSLNNTHSNTSMTNGTSTMNNFPALYRKSSYTQVFLKGAKDPSVLIKMLLTGDSSSIIEKLLDKSSNSQTNIFKESDKSHQGLSLSNKVQPQDNSNIKSKLYKNGLLNIFETNQNIKDIPDTFDSEGKPSQQNDMRNIFDANQNAEDVAGSSDSDGKPSQKNDLRNIFDANQNIEYIPGSLNSDVRPSQQTYMRNIFDANQNAEDIPGSSDFDGKPLQQNGMRNIFNANQNIEDVPGSSNSNEKPSQQNDMRNTFDANQNIEEIQGSFDSYGISYQQNNDNKKTDSQLENNFKNNYIHRLNPPESEQSFLQNTNSANAIKTSQENKNLMNSELAEKYSNSISKESPHSETKLQDNLLSEKNGENKDSLRVNIDRKSEISNLFRKGAVKKIFLNKIFKNTNTSLVREEIEIPSQSKYKEKAMLESSRKEKPQHQNFNYVFPEGNNLRNDPHRNENLINDVPKITNSNSESEINELLNQPKSNKDFEQTNNEINGEELDENNDKQSDFSDSSRKLQENSWHGTNDNTLNEIISFLNQPNSPNGIQLNNKEKDKIGLSYNKKLSDPSDLSKNSYQDKSNADYASYFSNTNFRNDENASPDIFKLQDNSKPNPHEKNNEVDLADSPGENHFEIKQNLNLKNRQKNPNDLNMVEEGKNTKINNPPDYENGSSSKINLDRSKVINRNGIKSGSNTIAPPIFQSDLLSKLSLTLSNELQKALTLSEDEADKNKPIIMRAKNTAKQKDDQPIKEDMTLYPPWEKNKLDYNANNPSLLPVEKISNQENDESRIQMHYRLPPQTKMPEIHYKKHQLPDDFVGYLRKRKSSDLSDNVGIRKTVDANLKRKRRDTEEDKSPSILSSNRIERNIKTHSLRQLL